MKEELLTFGTKNLSLMITNRQFMVVFIICFVSYLLPEIFFSEVMLYITGGIFAGSISQVLKLISYDSETNLTFLIWGVLLLVTIYGYIKVKNKLIKYLLIFLAGLFLYLIDFGLYSIVSYDPTIKDRIILSSGIRAICFLLFSVTLKSLALSWIYYKGKK